MMRDLEDKLFRGDAERGRREARMEEYRRNIRRRFDIAPDVLPANHVELVAQPCCDVFRVDTARVE